LRIFIKTGKQAYQISSILSSKYGRLSQALLRQIPTYVFSFPLARFIRNEDLGIEEQKDMNSSLFRIQYSKPITLFKHRKHEEDLESLAKSILFVLLPSLDNKFYQENLSI